MSGTRSALRDAAIAEGAAYYFTGLPCGRGHVVKRLVKNHSCTRCNYEKGRKQAAVIKACPQRTARKKELGRLWRLRNLEHHRANSRRNGRRLAGLPEPTRPAPERCECCGKPPGKYAMALDHDHASGAFRGWLCNRCNLAIGLLGDDLPAVERAVQYLKGASP